MPISKKLNIKAAKYVESQLQEASKKNDFFREMPRYLARIGNNAAENYGLTKLSKKAYIWLYLGFRKPFTSKYAKKTWPLLIRLLATRIVLLQSPDKPESEPTKEGIPSGFDPCESAVFHLGIASRRLRDAWEAWTDCMFGPQSSNPSSEISQWTDQIFNPGQGTSETGSPTPPIPVSPCDDLYEEVLSAEENYGYYLNFVLTFCI